MHESAKCSEGQVRGSNLPLAQRLEQAAAPLRGAAGVEVRLNEPMAAHTSLGVGGPAAIFAIPHSPTAVAAVMRAARAAGLPVLPIGRGTNLLVREGGFPGIIAHLGESLSAISVSGSTVTAQCGAVLAEVCEAAAAAGLSGLEFAAGVPGSVGGAVAMNAGAGIGEIGRLIESVEVVHGDGRTGRCTAAELQFGYRRSCVRDQECVVVAVTFELAPADPAAVRRAMFEAVESRCLKQPLSLGSCGSVFKRPPNDFAGRLLEEAGVKGLRIGGARFSLKHANFIVNEGNATAQDVTDLIDTAKRRVREVCGVVLEEEVCIVGDPAPPRPRA